MVLHKKPPLTFIKVLFLAFIYIISLCSLFVAFQFYEKGHRSYRENLGTRMSPTGDPETTERKNAKYQWTENLSHETPAPPSPSPASSSEYLNIKSYPYIINEPNKCQDETPFLIFLIETIASEVENRKAIRATFGNMIVYKRFSIMCLFLLGKDNTQDPNAILEESKKYQDIIQKDFQDTYKNLTIKTMMGIEWVSNYCPTARYVMKTDSDMFVNTDRLLDLLGPDLPQKLNFFTGFVMENHQPHRSIDSKWYMPHSLFPDPFYPTLCSGTGYVFSGDVASKILRSSSKVKYVYLEDVFVAICLDREGIKITHPPNGLFHNYRVEFSPCAYNSIITSHYINPTFLIKYWSVVQNDKEKCSMSRESSTSINNI
ncbi:beta-1,3-galactosyltransferase 2-like [Hyla sarda]|uniref:beta-1,3-galactosyltransferase 2-like n=1 Tax=Hyla sarda TaxID=327740 RepID=UPI0024C34868|nr:beta-1,3-galactosyltransferase 2-like [Hyla sarda]